MAKKKAAQRAALSNGAGEESRTPDLRITNALLYQLSYAGGKPVRCYFLHRDAFSARLIDASSQRSAEGHNPPSITLAASPQL
jgi:hypothetical protein